jgi:ribosomal protein S18 acetylase RimI-like enzyme
LEISHMCVDSACRGRGIGTLLLNAVFAHAKQCDPAPQNIVLSVMTDLSAAMALYVKKDFRNDGPPVENGSCFLQKMVCSCSIDSAQ